MPSVTLVDAPAGGVERRPVLLSGWVVFTPWRWLLHRVWAPARHTPGLLARLLDGGAVCGGGQPSAGVVALTMAECIPSATWWVEVISMPVNPASCRLR